MEVSNVHNTYTCEERVQWLSTFHVFHRDRREFVTKPDRRHRRATVRVRRVFTVGICVLVAVRDGTIQLFVRGRHNFDDVIVRIDACNLYARA
jgi:hypothetical protein